MLRPGSKAIVTAIGGQGNCLGEIPDGWKIGEQGDGGASPREVFFLIPTVLFEELLVFEAFVLKPDLYLGLGESIFWGWFRGRSCSWSGQF